MSRGTFEEHHWRDESRRLLAIQRSIAAAAGDLDLVMQCVTDGVLSLIPQATAALVEMRDGQHLVVRATAGHMRVKAGSVPVSHSLSGLCLTTAEPQLCNDAHNDSRVDQTRWLADRSVICAPIPTAAGPVGVLKALSHDPGMFGERDLLILQLLVIPLAFGLAASEQVRAARQTEALATRFTATFEQAAVGIAHVGIDGSFLKVNDRFCEIAGHGRESLIRGGFQQITHEEDLSADLDHVASLVAGIAPSYAMEKRYIRSDGGTSWANLTVSLVRQADGAPDFLVAVIEDISARKAAEELAMFDALTGLPNRRSLLRGLDNRLNRLRKSGIAVGIAFLDLDRFKSVNDRLGHAEGDRCLVTVAALLRDGLREDDVVARLAGDEFVIVMPGATRETGRRMLRRLRRDVAAASDSEKWQIGLSAGLVIAAATSTESAATLIAAADTLMYQAKRGTGERIAVADITGRAQLRAA